MSNPYTSSIVVKYGDLSSVRKDSTTIQEILNRQGMSLLFDAIADHIGQSNLQYNYTSEEKSRILNSIINELKDAILERT